jgi:teichuronopeptide biosynthesis TupA-like protein
MQRLDERAVVTQNFQRVFGRPPNLQIPTTFNEKIAYKILYDRRPILTRLQDKLQARDYVALRIGAGYLTELYHVCRSPAEIEWLKLPRRFVIKMNHGSGMNIFVTNKAGIDVNSIGLRLETWLATNFYHCLLEWAYRDIRPTIFIEEMLSDDNGGMVVDWKFFTFDGRAEFLQVDVDRFTQQKRNVYDRRLNRLPFRGNHPNLPTDPKFPDNIDLMFSLADKLGSGLDFVRIDMYNLSGRIVFGEFTNYPGAGLERFYPPEFDELYGSKWRWPPPY